MKNDGSEIISYNTQDGKVELEIKLDHHKQTAIRPVSGTKNTFLISSQKNPQTITFRFPQFCQP